MTTATQIKLTKHSRYRVVKPAATLRWQTPIAPYAWKGESLQLKVGDELEYLGRVHGPGSDDVDYDLFSCGDVRGHFWPNNWGLCDTTFLEEIK